MTDRTVIKSTKRRPDARPGEILTAALTLFSERGFAATRLEDVASRAGLSKAAIYLYFNDKMALLKALVEDMVVANFSLARNMATSHGGSTLELLQQVITLFGDRVANTPFPSLVKLIISESRAHPEIGKFYLDNVVRQGLPFFEELIRAGIAAGDIRPVDPRLAVKSLIAPVLLAAIWRSVFEPLGADTLDMEAWTAHNRDMLVRGLRP